MGLLETRITRGEFLSIAATLAAAGGSSLSLLPPGALAALSPPERIKGYTSPVVARHWKALAGSQVECTLCPNGCVTGPGERGVCRVRENRAGTYYSLSYGNPCSLNVDPIEKKPLFHVLPGSRSFSLATAGCNLRCRFCQNWEISQMPPEELYNFKAGPADIVAMARELGCRSIACTYVEPSIFFEYMQAIGEQAKKAGLLMVVHSNGFISQPPLREWCGVLGAANIDLKGFSEGYYRDMSQGSLAPVLRSLKAIRLAGVHLEITNLVVPGRNDGPAMYQPMFAWIRDELGADTPLHLSRFHPHYQLRNLPPTPEATIVRMREQALESGLRYVYVGNFRHIEGESTRCPGCGRTVIERQGYAVRSATLDHNGACPGCGHRIPGIWK